MPRPPIALARTAGVVAGLVGIAVSDLVAWFLAPAAAPLAAVGSAIIDLLPAPLVNFGKDALGTADKPVLVVLVAAGVLVLCGLGGQLELRRRFLGAVVFGLVAVIGVAAVLSRPPFDLVAVVPTLVGLAAGYVVLSMLVNRLTRVAPAAETAGPTASPAAIDRRAFLRTTVLVGALAVVGAAAGRMLVGAAARINEARARIQLPRPAVPAPPVPSGADLKVAGLSPYLTPNENFYRIDTALQVPVIDPDDWSLRITGMVDRQVTISYAELLQRPLVEHLTTLTCVSNYVGGGLVGNARWLGFPIRDLLAEAGAQPGADMVLSRSHDGWTAGTPLEVLTDPGRQALLAVGMNGEPLPVDHGFPVRMVVPGLYGYVSATKWVVELELTTFAADQGYWTPLGWSALGPIKLASRIDVPHGSEGVTQGLVTVAGVAWAQHTGISKVQVRVDDGEWADADLAATAGPDTWRQWRYRWDAPGGSHRLSVRAFDTEGRAQVEDEAAPAPDGATGLHTIEVSVRPA